MHLIVGKGEVVGARTTLNRFEEDALMRELLSRIEPDRTWIEYMPTEMRVCERRCEEEIQRSLKFGVDSEMESEMRK